MHYLQKQILDELRAVESLRYTELNKSGVESGHFRYHLQQLVKDGYVEQLGRGEYTLTSEGQQFADRLSEHRINPHEMPKVITYTLVQHHNTLYLYRKPKQPYKGLLNMVGGKVHVGETTHAAAVREVQEKTELKVKELEQAAVFEVLIKQKESVFTHVIAYVFISNLQEGLDKIHPLEAISTKELESRQDLAPDFIPIFNSILKKKKSFGVLNISI